VKLDELVVVLLTSFSISDDNVQRAYEIRKHCVDMVEPSKKGDDVGAGMRISLGQETGKKDTQSLGAVRQRWIKHMASAVSYIQRMQRGKTLATLHSYDCIAEKLPRPALERQQVDGRYSAQQGSQTLEIRP
jgi:hypothetical protein